MKRHRGTAGFTFIEMMVVVSIIGLLIVLVGPRFIRGQEKAEVRAAASSNATRSNRHAQGPLSLASFPRRAMVRACSGSIRWRFSFGPVMGNSWAVGCP